MHPPMATDVRGGAHATPDAWCGSVDPAGRRPPALLADDGRTASVNVDTDPAALPAWQLVQNGTMDLAGSMLDDNPFIARHRRGAGDERPATWALAPRRPRLRPHQRRHLQPRPSTVTSAVVTTGARCSCSTSSCAAACRRDWALGGAAGVRARHRHLADLVRPALAPRPGPARWSRSSARPGVGSPGGGGHGRRASGRSCGPVIGGRAARLRPVAAVGSVAGGTRRRSWSSRRSSDSAPWSPTTLGLRRTEHLRRVRVSLPRQPHRPEPVRTTLRNIADMLCPRQNGMLLWSPVVIVALLGLARGRGRHAASGLGGRRSRGSCYLLVHLRLNRASGGLPYDYRYPLEALTLAAPALVLGRAGARRSGQGGASGSSWSRSAASLLLQGTVGHHLRVRARSSRTSDA